jgi:acetyltransferase-like isoleucine patch superfamily enzyme
VQTLGRKDPVGYVRSLGVKVGSDCRFINVASIRFGSEPWFITIGNHVTVSGEVRFITHDGGVWVLRDEYPNIDVMAPIVIGSNVFVGLQVMIMPGVTVGNNSVIGARSLVTHDVPADTVVAGHPARRLCSTVEYRERMLVKARHDRGRRPPAGRAN